MPAEPAPAGVNVDRATLQSYVGSYRNEEAGAAHHRRVERRAADDDASRAGPPMTLVATSPTSFRVAEREGLTINFEGRGGMIERVVAVVANPAAGLDARRDTASRARRPARPPQPPPPAPAAPAPTADDTKPAARTAAAQLARLPRRECRRQRRRAGRGRRMGRRHAAEHPLENADSRHLQREPRGLGQPRVRGDRRQQRRRQDVPNRPLWRRRAGERPVGAHLEDLLPRQGDRKDPVGARRLQRRAEGEAAHQGQPGQFHAGNRRPARRRDVRLDRHACRLGHGRQAALADRHRRARQRLVLRSRHAVGTLELADHSRRQRDRAGRSSEGLVHRGLRRGDRQAAVAHRARRDLDAGARRRCSAPATASRS